MIQPPGRDKDCKNPPPLANPKTSRNVRLIDHFNPRRQKGKHKNPVCWVYVPRASCSIETVMPSKPYHRRVLGEKIRACRKQTGLTQEKLAEKADLHHNFIGEVERGNMEISLTSLLKIAKALKVRVRDLVEEI